MLRVNYSTAKTIVRMRKNERPCELTSRSLSDQRSEVDCVVSYREPKPN